MGYNIGILFYVHGKREKYMRHRWDYFFICLGQCNISCCKIDSHYIVCWQRG